MSGISRFQVVIIPFLCFLHMPILGQTPDSSRQAIRPFGFRLDYNMKGDFWFTSDDDDSEENVGHAFDYLTEFIPAHAFQCELLWKGSTWFQFYYEKAFTEDKIKQKAILTLSDKASSIERIRGYLDFVILFGVSNNSVIESLSKIRLFYKHHIFFGKAIVQENTRFYPKNDTVQELLVGDEIRFKSDFEEISINFHSSKYLWLGLYYNGTTKPHEASTQVTQVLETDITGFGLKILRDHNAYILDANVGLVRFHAEQGDFRSFGFETLIHFEWHPRLFLIGSSKANRIQRNSLSFSPLLGLQFSMQIAGEAEGQESTGVGELAMDIIIDGGLRLQYHF